MTKDMCNHFIGLQYGYEGDTPIYVTDIPRYDRSTFDRRHCYADLFAYCPRCGKRLDWKLLRALARELEGSQ